MEDIKDSRSNLIFTTNQKDILLKPDHAKRPLWICSNNHIFLEPTSRSLFERATEFLIAIAEPVSRPHYIHEYVLTRFSLYAAASIGQDRGLNRETIIKTLEVFAKNATLPPEVISFINKSTMQYGRVKLVLLNKKYYMETSDIQTLNHVLNNIRLLKDEYERYKIIKEQELAEETKKTKPIQDNFIEQNQIPNVMNGNKGIYYLLEDAAEKMEIDEEKPKGERFEVQEKNVEEVKKQCQNIQMPLIEEYEFKNDINLPTMKIDLKPLAQVRPYQEQCLSKMFSSGRARSGIVVLPCGAGKTLVGISALCTVKKPTIILCNSSVAVEQWCGQIKKWTNAEDQGIKIVRFTSKTAGKDELLKENEAGILLATYSMMSFQGTRSKEAEYTMNMIMKREWGLLIADEVHVLPAKYYRAVITSCKTHSKLGLSATLARQDDKIGDLNYLIGPKLFEANWQQLQLQGFIAKVQCLEVWCPMMPEFFVKYIDSVGTTKDRLYVANPYKYIACQWLIEKHEKRGDKIIVFADSLFVLLKYADRMNRPKIYSKTSTEERTKMFWEFENTPGAYTLFLSRVGDTAIDLPSANVIIQISSLFGSERQEAQRLGRILRPKHAEKGEYNAYFYTLISRNTREMFHSHRRQKFLVNQGYTFQIVKDLEKEYTEEFKNRCDMYKKDQQLKLLDEAIYSQGEEWNKEEVGDEDELADKEVESDLILSK